MAAAEAVAALGTLNPGKLVACRKCFALWPGAAYRVVPVAAESGVREQPWGLEETTRGAINRAQAALCATPDAAIGVGLESGLLAIDTVGGGPGTRTFDFCVCAIAERASAEGRTRTHVGVSSMFQLPPRVAALVAAQGYNGAFEAVLGQPADPDGAGVLAQLSGGVLSRPAQMGEALHAALLALRRPDMYAV